jgi:hypothetical protein
MRQAATPGRPIAASGFRGLIWSGLASGVAEVVAETDKQALSNYLRRQGDRCLKMSRNCMDLGIARELRLMSEEYFAEASRLESNSSTTTSSA